VKKDIKFRIIKVCIVIFTVLLIISLYFLIKDFIEYKASDSSHSELIDSVITTADTKENEQNVPAEINIDWEKLKNINNDIIGWIRIQNTHIDYPILKCDKELKYLNRSFDNSFNKNGSIFTLNINPFIDRVTTIYGHNMKSGLMFTDLSKYMDANFFKEHLTFEIYTEFQDYKATVFSVYSITEKIEENNIKDLNFDEEIQYYKSKSVHTVENINEINKIVKLSTCSYLNNKSNPTTERYYIVANLEEIKNF